MPKRECVLKSQTGVDGVVEEPSGGKGSHSKFLRNVAGRVWSYTMPTSRADVLPGYLNPLREQLALTADDGVSGAEFFSKKKPKAKTRQQG